MRPLAPSLSGETRADVCIVGGGFTGLWTAINLKRMKPELDVVIIEADICGAGRVAATAVACSVGPPSSSR